MFYAPVTKAPASDRLPTDTEQAQVVKLNRHWRRTMRPLTKGVQRTDGLPKNGYSWTAYATRIALYRAARAVKLARERAARRIA